MLLFSHMISVIMLQVRAIRVSFVGELGWELHVPKESCSAVYRALMEEGGQGQLINAGYRAIDSLSIEKGYPHWHAEIRFDERCRIFPLLPNLTDFVC